MRMFFEARERGWLAGGYAAREPWWPVNEAMCRKGLWRSHWESVGTSSSLDINLKPLPSFSSDIFTNRSY